MGLVWKKEHLDIILVPSGLLIMFGYHLILLYKCLRVPQTTTIGHDNHCRAAWVQRMMQVDSSNRGQALSVINANASAASSLSSISLVLSSLIGAWLGSSTQTAFTSELIYGDTSPTMISIKYLSLLCFFLVAFGSFVQTTRCFVHANYLLTMPNADIPASYVEKAVVNGSNFWSVGVRALYFATSLLMWVFGPIPMFVSSVITVVVLHNLDWNTNPLFNFQPPSEILKKIGQEITTVSRAIDHHGKHEFEAEP